MKQKWVSIVEQSVSYIAFTHILFDYTVVQLKLLAVDSELRLWFLFPPVFESALEEGEIWLYEFLILSAFNFEFGVPR